MINTKNRWGRALGAALLAGSLGACDFIESTETNPNAVPVASLDQLFTSAQVNTFYFNEGELSRIAAVWLQQAAGTDRQFSALDLYQLQEDEIGSSFGNVYTGGGLIDIRRATEIAEENNRPVYAGILKIHEAYLIGMLASFVGDIAYSEAVNPEISTPALDEQAEVYADVQALLTEAISNLQGGTAAIPTDLNFRGDSQKWIAVANTLKARFFMHWVEAQRAGGNAAALAQTACGGDCVAQAIAAAQNGVQTSANNWRTIHSSASTESNIWFQFLSERSGYISAGAFAVDELKERNDPRLTVFYGEGSGAFAGQIVGSPPGNPAGDPGTAASALSEEAPNGYGLPQASFPIVSCAETHFILAEANFYQGNTAAAQQALQAGVACEETRLGVDIPVTTSVTGDALLEEIVTQKYFALFLNPEILNDYKRTCLPNLIDNDFIDLEDMPRRFFYAQAERQTNPNIPEPNAQPEANDNDPNACT